MIKYTNVTKTYESNSKKIHAVRGLNIHIKKGEMFGFLGPNGAGKTTTIKLLLGLIKPTKGKISIAGKKPTDLEPKKIMGFLPENPHFYKYLTGEELLRFAGNLFHIPSNILEKRIKKLLKQVKLSHVNNQYIKHYSKGMMQRIGIAQSLINDPEIILLDEPMSGLDPIGRKEVKELLIDLHKKGKTIFFNTHILNDVEELCTHIGIIHKGKLLKYGTIKSLTRGKPLEDYFVSIIKKEEGK